MARARLTKAQSKELRQILEDELVRLRGVVDQDFRDSREGRDHLVGDDVDHSNEDGEAALTARFRNRDSTCRGRIHAEQTDQGHCGRINQDLSGRSGHG